MSITPLHRFGGWGLSTYAELVWRTARFQLRGEARWMRASGDRPRIIAAWHGMTMMLMGCIVAQGDAREYVLPVPDDSRGAVLSVWARRLGTIPFAISMEAESMVAARRLLALIRQMRPELDRAGEAGRPSGGKNLYINPDGPGGPSREPKGGVAFIARKTRAVVVPAGAFTATAFRIPRWDRYVVPFPFSRIAVVIGEPLTVLPGADLEGARVMIRQRLNEVERAAEELYRTVTHST